MNLRSAGIHIGLAYNGYIDSLNEEQLKEFDYIEIPFELLHYDELVLDRIIKKPLILHCASLSMAGYVEPAEKIKTAIKKFISSTGTPWVGEHLSFILAEKLDENFYEEYAPGEPYNIGYTVGPVMNKASVDHIIEKITRYRNEFEIPFIVENSPVYFTTPGSTMSQIEFINAICNQSDTELLLDLTHFYITAHNFSFDPIRALKKFPMERVKEIHVSGVSTDQEICWDNHAGKAPDIIFKMLEIVLKNCKPTAITLEYNWASNFPWTTISDELSKVKEKVYKTGAL